jgi:Holliday junction resolvase RusA-like endonuclease
MKLQLNLEIPTSLNQLYINEHKYNPKTKRYEPTNTRILSEKGQASKRRLQKYAKKQMVGQDWDYDYTLNNYIYMDVVIYFNKKGRDDNNIYKLLCDSLEKICYDNDSRVLIRTQRIYIDKDNPRIEVTLLPVEFVGIFDNQVQFEVFEDNCKFCSYYRSGSCSVLKGALENRIQEEIDKNLICHKFKKKKT